VSPADTFLTNCVILNDRESEGFENGNARMSMIDLRGAKVLVVEDEYFIAADLVRALSAAGGRPVGPASSVEQARSIMDDHEIDAAILDLNLRGEMAYPLVAELSERAVPCVIMSGYGPDSLPEALRGVPSLEKPVDYDRVVESLKAQLTAKAD
jgi:DNA-binding NtrC family response regulator